MKKILALFLLGSSLGYNLLAQEQNIKKEKYSAGPWEDAAGYAQAVKVGNNIYISGHVSSGDFAQQVERIYKGLEHTLSQYGATFQNVVKENLYTLDIEEMKKHNEIRKAFYKNDYPAATWLQIDRLYMEGAMLEVELIAVLPEK